MEKQEEYVCTHTHTNMQGYQPENEYIVGFISVANGNVNLLATVSIISVVEPGVGVDFFSVKYQPFFRINISKLTRYHEKW